MAVQFENEHPTAAGRCARQSMRWRKPACSGSENVGYDKNNIFAKILRGEIRVQVYEDAHTLSFMDVMPQSNGHTLVIPKSQAEDCFDVDRRCSAH